MYLAGILALCALLHVSAHGHARGEPSSFEIAPVLYPSSAQEPAKSDTSAQPSSSQPDDRPATQTQDQSSTPSTGNQPQAPSDSTQPGSTKPQAGATSKKTAKKKHAATSGGEPQKRVIHRGSTVEPTTQLAQGITEEQAAKQREATNQLLANTDASLQKLSGRQLTKDEQDTVTQIRRFMQQVKTADAAGDLQRAHKLAVKARLLADALVKP